MPNLFWLLWALPLLGFTIAGMALLWWLTANLTYARRAARAVARAGFVEKQAATDFPAINYTEGPNNGPLLLLIHGQAVDWRNWSPVLPALARDFHVVAIDCYGHGSSAHAPGTYTARKQAQHLAAFIETTFGTPALVAGHSSGGLIAAALAAQAPHLVNAVFFEDPPFFASVLPRAEKTFNHIALAAIAHAFLASGEKDFTLFHLNHSPMWDLFKGLKPRIQKSVGGQRQNHPGRPPRIAYLPPGISELWRGFESYDPRFGDALFTGTYHDGLDHAETLSQITVPTTLVHTNWSYDPDGILLAAMDDKDAACATNLLHDTEYLKLDCGHEAHREKSAEFITALLHLKQRAGL